MNKTQVSLILLIIYLAIIFQLGERSFGGTEPVLPSTVVNLVIILAVLSVFIIPTLYRYSLLFLIIIWSALYLLARLVLFNSVPLIGGLNIYLTIADIAMLWLAIGLAYNLTRNLHSSEELVEKLTFSGFGKRIYTLAEATEEVKLEFIRSRRYNHPLSILLLEPVSGSIQADIQRTVQEIQKDMMDRFLLSNLGQIISQESRRTDLVLNETKGGRFIVLCTETTNKGVTGLAERIRSTAEERLGLSLAYGVASFPDEASTFEDLMHKAEQELIQLYTASNLKTPDSNSKSV